MRRLVTELKRVKTYLVQVLKEVRAVLELPALVDVAPTRLEGEQLVTELLLLLDFGFRLRLAKHSALCAVLLAEFDIFQHL